VCAFMRFLWAQDAENVNIHKQYWVLRRRCDSHPTSVEMVP
jgi:hypothetical protein